MLNAYHHFDKILTTIFHTKMNRRYEKLNTEVRFAFDVSLNQNYFATI